MRLVVDDVLLFAVLAEKPDTRFSPYREAAGRNEVFTTSSWLWRLSRAGSRGGRGALSGMFEELDDEGQHKVRAALADLPAGIGLVATRRLVPVMVAIPGQLNFLTAEAVAAAVMLDAKVAVTTVSPLLAAAAANVGVPVETVAAAE